MAHLKVAKWVTVRNVAIPCRWVITALSNTPGRQLSTDSHIDTAHSVRPFQEIPGPKSWPLIGSSWTYWPLIRKYDNKHLIESNMGKYREFGKIVRERIPGRPDTVLLFDPKDFARIYQHEGRYPVRPRFLSLTLYRQKRKDWYPTIGFGCMQGKGWYDLRSKIQPHLMRTKAVNGFLPIVDRVATKFVGILPRLLDSNGEIENFLRELYKWTVESASLVLLDYEIDCQGHDVIPGSDAEKLINAVDNIYKGIVQLETSLSPLWTYVTTPAWERFVRANDDLTRIVLDRAELGKQRLLEKGNTLENPTFLESFLAEGLNPGDGLADLMLASIDTTSHTLGFVLYHLAINGNAQEKCYQEIRQVLPSADTPVTSDTLQKLPYFKACIKESSRILPTNGIIFRALDTEVVLSNYRIPAGVTLITQNQVACLLEENFPNPMDFQPERWLTGSANKASPLLVLPFGHGPRMCIGKPLSDLEVWILLAKMLRKFKVEWMSAEELGFYFNVVNVPDRPLHFRFTLRKE